MARRVRRKPTPLSPPSTAVGVPTQTPRHKLGTWSMLPWDTELSVLSYLPYKDIVQISLTCVTLHYRQHHVHVPESLEVHRKHLVSFLLPRLPKRENSHKVRVVMRRLKAFQVVGNENCSASYTRAHLLSGLSQLPYLFPNLVRLNLADSLMSTIGICRLADGIRGMHWKTLQQLELPNNLINSEVRSHEAVIA